MEIKYKIEYVDSNEDYQYIDVEFDCDFRWNNDSFDHEFGTEYYDSYAVLEKINWDKTKYTAEENKIIDDFIQNHNSEEYQSFDEHATNEYEKYCADWELDYEPDYNEPDYSDYEP